jgi:DNA-directed RNA polymerase specialized sigma24 family protein
MNQHTAEAVFQNLQNLPSKERTKFFQLLGEVSLDAENQRHEQVFGHLNGAEFTAAQAADYLDVSMSTFRRYVYTKRLKASGRIGRSDMFATKELKIFKRALRDVKGA